MQLPAHSPEMRHRHAPARSLPARALLPAGLLLAALALLPEAGCSKTVLTQILPPGARIDVFPQISRAQLDAVFVIDDSRYMGVHQKRVADSLGRFLAWLDKNQIDYHLGLLSTDVARSPGVFLGGGGRHYFANQDASAALPAAVLALGGTGSAISPVLAQLDLALKGPPGGFLRPGAALFLVAVTDNNDPWSAGEDLYYFRAFKGAKGQGNDGLVTLSVLAGDVPKGCSLPDPKNPGNSFVAEAAPRLKGLAQQLGGRFKSLCAPDFDAVFDELGATASGLRRSFRLARPPAPASLQVRVKARCDTRPEALAFCGSLSDECGEAEAYLVCTPRPAQDGPPAVEGWAYDESTLSITFTGAALPPRGALVEVQYQDRVGTP